MPTGGAGPSESRRPSLHVAARRPRWDGARAGVVRIVFALVGLAAGALIPTLAGYLPLFLANFVLSLVLQGVIALRLRRTSVTIAMGLADVLFVTLLVHLLGSTQSVVSFLYLLIPILFATTTSRRRVSMTLAAAGALAYVVVLLLEHELVLPYAPAVPGAVPPSRTVVFFSGLVVVVSVLTTTRFVSQLIAALRLANARLEHQSQHDELTGLHNRRYLQVRLSSELARVQRGARLVVLMIDLDGFKRVNDEEGHDAGDRVLKEVASALLHATRRSDVVARVGGDEFVVLLPDTGLDGDLPVATRVVDEARAVGSRSYPALRVTASVGVTAARPEDDPETLLRRADEGVYRAKREGGDRVAMSSGA